MNLLYCHVDAGLTAGSEYMDLAGSNPARASFQSSFWPGTPATTSSDVFETAIQLPCWSPFIDQLVPQCYGRTAPDQFKLDRQL
jgi:hypothetical protein